MTAAVFPPRAEVGEESPRDPGKSVPVRLHHFELRVRHLARRDARVILVHEIRDRSLRTI